MENEKVSTTAGEAGDQVEKAVSLLRQARLNKVRAFQEEYEALCRKHKLFVDYEVQCVIRTDGTPRFYANRVIQDLPRG